jgi:hypothetical protein
MRNVSRPVPLHESRRAIAVAMAAAFSLSLVVAAAAFAAPPHSQVHVFFDEHFHYDGTTPCPETKDQWLNFNSPGNRDSPLDSNIKAWRVIVTPDCYTAASTWQALEHLDTPILNVKNLSFDWRNESGTPPGTAVGGSPRIVVFLSTGDSVHMDAVSCRKNLTGFTWSRSDFTGFKTADASCTINLNASIPFTNTATQSAWQVFATAYEALHPGTSLTYAFIDLDQPGTYYLDRMAFGTQRLYGSGNTPTKQCTTESSC